MPKVVGVNEKGRRIGESHPRAKLTDAEIDIIRDLHESGIGYRAIAKKFDEPDRTISRSQVRNIVKCTRRAQTPERFKTVKP